MATYRKLPSGNWQARVMIDGKYKPIGTFKTKKQAEVEANKIEEKLYYGQSIDDREMLFSEVVKVWLDYKEANTRQRTYDNAEGNARNHIQPYFGHKKIMSIRKADILNWINIYAKKDLEYSTKNKAFDILSEIFSFAVYQLEVISFNPCSRLKIGKETVKKKRKYYNLEELNLFLDYMEQHKPHKHKEYRPDYVLFFLMSRTGLRIAEALALEWRDLNGDRLTIDRQVYKDKNNKDIVSPLKTAASYRTVKLDKEILAELNQFKLAQKKSALKYNSFTLSEEGIMFQNQFGGYKTYSGIKANLGIHCDNAGVEYKGTHSFRHTHAVLSLEAGATLEYVSARLGHESIDITSKEYSDVTPKIERDELEKVGSYMARNWHDMKDGENKTP